MSIFQQVVRGCAAPFVLATDDDSRDIVVESGMARDVGKYVEAGWVQDCDDAIEYLGSKCERTLICELSRDQA